MRKGGEWRVAITPLSQHFALPREPMATACTPPRVRELESCPKDWGRDSLIKELRAQLRELESAASPDQGE